MTKLQINFLFLISFFLLKTLVKQDYYDIKTKLDNFDKSLQIYTLM